MKEDGYCYNYIGELEINKCESVNYERKPYPLHGEYGSHAEFRCMKKNRKIGNRADLRTCVKSPKWCPLKEVMMVRDCVLKSQKATYDIEDENRSKLPNFHSIEINYPCCDNCFDYGGHGYCSWFYNRKLAEFQLRLFDQNLGELYICDNYSETQKKEGLI